MEYSIPIREPQGQIQANSFRFCTCTATPANYSSFCTYESNSQVHILRHLKSFRIRVYGFSPPNSFNFCTCGK